MMKGAVVFWRQACFGCLLMTSGFAYVEVFDPLQLELFTRRKDDQGVDASVLHLGEDKMIKGGGGREKLGGREEGVVKTGSIKY